MTSKEKRCLCRKLCRMYRAVLVCNFELNRLERLMDYLIPYPDFCYVIYDVERNRYFCSYFYLHNEDGIVVKIHSLGETIEGYVNGTKVFEIDLPSYIVELIDEYMYTCYNKKNSPIKFERVGTYDEDFDIAKIVIQK